MGHFFMRKPLAALTHVFLAGLLLASGGCAWLRPAPVPILPPDELYSQGPHLASYTFEIGNPDLEAETGHGIDLFLRFDRPSLRGEVAGFWNRIDGYVYPRNTGEVVRAYEKVLIPEINLGQLRMLIRAQYLVDAAGYNKVRGRPFRAAELADAITALVDS